MVRYGLTGSNIELGAAAEEVDIGTLEATAEETREDTRGLVLCAVDLLDLVAAAELEILAASVASLADGDIVADRRGEDLGRGVGHGAEGEGENSDGETHFDSGWLVFGY